MALPLYPSQHDRSSAGGLPLSGYMTMLIAAIMLPMLCLVAIIAWDYGHAARRTIEAERLDVANNIRIMIDREIEHTVGFLDGLSDAPGLRRNQPQVVDRVVAMALEQGSASLAVYGLDGHVIMTSTGPSPPVPAEKVGLAEIKAGQRHFVSNLIDVGDKPGLYFVSVPMRSEGKVVAMLTAGRSPLPLQHLLAEAGVRDGWTSSIVDRNGILLARGRESEVYVGLEAQKPIADAARGDAPAGLFDEISRHGRSISNSFERSSTSGWVAGVGVLTDVIEAPLWHSAVIMTVVGVALTLVSLLLAFMVAGNLSRAIRQLGIAAVAIAGGDAVRMPESSIAELRDVSRSIEFTGEVARRDRGAK
jgi:hypothetical protein